MPGIKPAMTAERPSTATRHGRALVPAIYVLLAEGKTRYRLSMLTCGDHVPEQIHFVLRLLQAQRQRIA
jgi:hypothetical protein